MRFSYVLALASALLLSACTNSTTNTLTGTSVSHGPSLSNKIYKSTDELMKYSRAVVTPTAPILVSTVGNVSEVETSSPLGRLISEQIAGRLVQLGYRVQETKLRSSLNIKQGITQPAEAGEYLISRDVAAVAGAQQAAAAVIGTYADAGDRIAVNLKLIDVASGRIVSNRDFDIAKTDDVLTLLRENAGRDNGFFRKGWAY